MTPEIPDAPYGDLKPEVAQLSGALKDDTVHSLRSAGAHLFMFLTQVAEQEVGELEGEAAARLSNVRSSTVALLSAIESVFVRS